MRDDLEILIVEDSPTQGVQLKHTLERNGYRATLARNGKEALSRIAERAPTVVISDIMMPEMDGYDLCSAVKTNRVLKDIPVILLTSLSELEDVIKALQCKADSFVTKPYNEQFLLSRVANILANQELGRNGACDGQVDILFGGRKYTLASEPRQITSLLLSTYENAVQKNLELIKTRDELRLLNEHLEERVRERTAALTAEIAERQRAEDQLRQSYSMVRQVMEGTVRAMATAIEARDPYTAGHQRRVSRLAVAIGQHMGLLEEDVDGIAMAGLIHDLGKISIPAEILSKPGRISPNEFNIVKIHTQIGHEILRTVEFPWPIDQVVLQHHERLNGTGYPAGLKDGEILLEARIVAVADVVEAMASHRPYRPALGMDMALQEISQNQGTVYDPTIVDACLTLVTQKDFTLE